MNQESMFLPSYRIQAQKIFVHLESMKSVLKEYNLDFRRRPTRFFKYFCKDSKIFLIAIIPQLGPLIGLFAKKSLKFTATVALKGQLYIFY